MAKKKETKSNKATSKATAKQAEDNEEVKNELKTEKEKFLRLFAEFENFKRRTAKERLELFTTASEEVMVALLPILDDFDRASNAIESENELVTGFVLIKNKLVDTLKSKVRLLSDEQRVVFDLFIDFCQKVKCAVMYKGNIDPVPPKIIVHGGGMYIY